MQARKQQQAHAAAFLFPDASANLLAPHLGALETTTCSPSSSSKKRKASSDNASSNSSSTSSSSLKEAIATTRQKIAQQLGSGAVKPDALVQELRQLQQQQQQRQRRPQSLEQLMDWVAAARHGQFATEGEAAAAVGGDAETSKPSTREESRAEQISGGPPEPEDPFTFEAIFKAAKQLRENLSTNDEARRAFFLRHYERELSSLGIEKGSPGYPSSPEGLADRLALARAFAAAAGRSGVPAASAQKRIKHNSQQHQQPLEARVVSGRRQRSKGGATGGGRSTRQGRNPGLSPLGFPSLLNVFFGGGDMEEDSEKSDQTQQENQPRHPLEHLLSGIFGGGPLEILSGPAAAPDLLQQLFEGAADFKGPEKKRQIDFLQPEQVDNQQQQASGTEWSEDRESNPQLLSLFNRAKQKGSIGLVDVLRKAFQDEGMRELAVVAVSKGLDAARAKAASAAGRYLLARLQDDGLLP
ncbi:uncharacterized protein LOC113146941 [Cyclospora cayetanensis]|uniref:Uncharacterized protein LOC113146941 n=1 Tax=Cyclospora cayetanensis TaxID=88456 RepID=A0A6P6RUP0_9EIME|nr:uncharacterized protein LOC113146941 [Cyclospora cayetanensis]